MKKSFLNSPYPTNYGNPEILRVGIFIGAFVTLFLFIFKPFGITSVDPPFWKYLGYGVVTFLGIALVQFAGPKLFPQFFLEKSYTIGKELFLSVILIVIIGLGNALYNHWFISSTSLLDIIAMIFNTFLVGIFPLTFLSLLEFNRQLKQNLQTSQEITLPDPIITKVSQGTVSEIMFVLPAEGNRKKVLAQDLVYIESVGNYANVVIYETGGLARNLYRTTLKSLEASNSLTSIIRCHRSYIVNLDQVIEVTGNAQGLKLHLKDCEDLIPVSRKYIPQVKESFEKLSKKANL